MGRASEGKRTQKAAKYGNNRSSNGKQKEKPENPSKRQRAAEDDEAKSEQPKKVGKLDELTDVSSFFDAVEEGVDFSEPSHSTYKPGEDDDDDEEEEDDGAEADAGADEDDEEESDDDDDDSEDEAGGDSMLVHIAKHKQQLAKLQENDPEFYEYMKSEGGDLMDFGADVDTADLEGNEKAMRDEDSDSDDDEDEEEEAEMEEEEEEDDDDSPEALLKKAQKGKQVLSMAQLEKWEDAAKRGKSEAVSMLLRAFDAAAVLLVDTDSGPAKKGAKKKKKNTGSQKKNMSAVRRFKFKIESGDVFDALLVCMTREMPAILMDEMLERPQSATDGSETDGRTDAAKWKPQRSSSKYTAQPPPQLDFRGCL